MFWYHICCYSVLMSANSMLVNSICANFMFCQFLIRNAFLHICHSDQYNFDYCDLFLTQHLYWWSYFCLHFRNSSRAQSQNRDDYDHDSSSISTLDQVVKQWMVAAAKCDYTTLFKMLRDDPRLAKAKDFTSGYTALHWACKHGNLDLVKLLVCLHL